MIDREVNNTDEIIQLITEVICSSRRWYFNLKETIPLAEEVVEALKKQGYKIVKCAG